MDTITCLLCSGSFANFKGVLQIEIISMLSTRCEAKSEHGGVIFMSDSRNISIKYSNFSQNNADGSGGAIFM